MTLLLSKGGNAEKGEAKELHIQHKINNQDFGLYFIITVGGEKC